ncbi:DNA helicase RecQ [Patescibacteria group bacterium]|nr:DNA helicase RecQ [Patescibacteria group bacterium]
MKDLLKKYFGFEEFRPFQEKVIGNVLAKNDTLVIMPTGGGKSLCYQLPALKFEGITLVISPLIALMKDQVDALKANGIAAEFLNSSLSYQEISRIQNRAQTGDLKILYLAPERLAMESFQNFLKTLTVSFIAIDEAHCISEWGHDFRPDYRNLKFFKITFPEVPIIALTATATPKVQQDIAKQLSLNKAKMYISSFDRKNLHFLILRKTNAFDKLVQLLKKHKDESAIIYCFSRKETEEIAEDLRQEGFKALPYHAGLDPAIRKQNQELFTKDEVRIMVATIAFGMGIDKPDVRLVVHWVFPKTLEGYYQEIGRAGRDGLPSECVTFYSYGDFMKHEYFIDKIEDKAEQENAREKMNQVVRYCEQISCRRKHLLAYFGEEYKKDNCGACDSCLAPKDTFEAAEVAQKIISGIIKTGGRFGKNYIIDVLKGSGKQQIMDNNHHQISVYGIVQDYSKEELKHIIKSLLNLGLLQSAQDKYPTLSVAQKGFKWLKQKEPLVLPKIKEDVLDQERKDISQYQLEYDLALFEKLRALRKQLADINKVPPFVIFSDVSLQEMAYYLPADKDNFSRIQGVGAQKLENFGDEFLKVITSHLKENNLVSSEVPYRRRKKIGLASRRAPVYEKTKKMILEKFSLSEIAKEQGLVEGTIINHLDRLLESGEDIDILYLKPGQKDFEKIKDGFMNRGDEKLKPVYEYLKEEYSYDTLKLARLFFKQAN